MTGRRKLTIPVEQKRHSGILYGPVSTLHPVIKDVGCAYQYDNRRHCYSVPIQHFDDILARLESAGHHVDLRAASW